MLWNNNRLRNKVLAIALALAAAGLTFADDASEHSPQLLLSAQRLKRLRRDRDRQTARWVNFENRVKTAPDSTQRGFELALYYVVTGDEARGREAVAWVVAHPSKRLNALLADWCWPLLTPDQRAKLSQADSVERQNEFIHSQLSVLKDGGFRNGETLYAVCEELAIFRETQHVDLREETPGFFRQLPIEFLLAMKPEELAHPDWMTHIAALALVSLDPNLESSQYLQGWAIEDAQTIREGPGVAYEFLWADPYLPGVGYQNMEPWMYDSEGRLFARSSWETNSCWIEISKNGVEELNCPPGWQEKRANFGHLTLIPMQERCVDIPRVANNEAVAVWKLKPHEKVLIWISKKPEPEEADSAGLWRPGANAEGKACIAPVR